jgi:hypothetical protein
MDRQGCRWAWMIVAAGLAVVPGRAFAQAAATPSGSPAGNASPYAAMYANPYANPYTNPFMNPYMTQQQVNGNVGMYFFAAQASNGGIGSGQLSGVRGRPTTPTPPPAPSTDSRRATDIPGANAARYFNRSYQPSPSAMRYYNRQGRYYPSNSH